MTEGSGKKVYPEPAWSPWETVIILALSMAVSAIPYWFAGTARGIGADLIAYLLQTACFFLLPLISVTVLRRQPLSALGLAEPEFPRCLRVGLIWGLLLYLVNVLISLGQYRLFPQYAHAQEYIVALLDQANGFETAFLLLLLLCLAPVSEELLFRAFFFPALVRRYGRAAGYLLCAAVFAATHFDLWTMLPIVCASLGFCRLYEKYRSLWYNIIAHAVWNGTALVIYCFTSLNI